jgi:hypothetical protein
MDEADDLDPQLWQNLQDESRELIDKVAELAEDLGLYHIPGMDAVDCSVPADQLVAAGGFGEAMRSDDRQGDMILSMKFRLGELWTTERIQNPTAYESEQQFLQAVPDPSVLWLERFEQLVAEGMSPLEAAEAADLDGGSV